MRNKKNKKDAKEGRKTLPIRLNLLFLAAFIIFTGVVVRLGFVQIVNGEDYKKQAEKQEDVNVSSSAPRGKIYDRNYNTIVSNKALNAITYTRTSTTSQEERLKVATKLADMIHVSTKKITDRDKKDFWILTHPNEAKKLVQKEADLKGDEKVSDDKLYELQLKRITDKELNQLTKKICKCLRLKDKWMQAMHLRLNSLKTKMLNQVKLLTSLSIWTSS